MSWLFRTRAERQALLRLERLEDRCTPTVTFTVNTLDDTPVAVLGAGTALDSYRHVSLRSAVQESRVTPDSVVIQMTNLRGTITLESALPALSNSYGIFINNASGASGLTVKRDSGAINFDLFQITSGTNATIGGLTLRNGLVPYGLGGAILNYGNLTLSGDLITANGAGEGGGIYNAVDKSSDTDPTLTLIGTSVTNNMAVAGDGGGIYNEGEAVVSYSSNVSNNVCQGGGGGIYNAGGLTVDGSTISGNLATGGNGGGINTPGSLTVKDSTLTGNILGRKDGLGGGIFVKGSADVSNTLIGGNIAGLGTGIYVVTGSPFSFSGTLVGNTIVFGPELNAPTGPGATAPQGGEASSAATPTDTPPAGDVAVDPGTPLPPLI
jgi:hypothetical protein